MSTVGNVLSSKYFEFSFQYINGQFIKSVTSHDFEKMSRLFYRFKDGERCHPTSIKILFNVCGRSVNPINLDSMAISQKMADRIVVELKL